MNGIIVIDKPQGMTSHDVVAFLRRKTGVKRVGHSGTLDPMAAGVLPVFIGKATRAIEYAGIPGDNEAKLYRCTMKLGIETDTQDIWGTPRADSCEAAIMPDEAAVERVLKSFEGAGVQTPPMYSAVKIGGHKLYEYARQGLTPDPELIKPRDIYIKHITVNAISLENKEVAFDVLCSKGVYIRTLCSDAGRLLGCGAVMSGLYRLKSDGFSINDAVQLDTLRGEGAELPLLPMDAPLMWLERVDLDAACASRFAQGQTVSTEDYERGAALRGSRPEGVKAAVLRVYGSGGFLGIGELCGDSYIKPIKVFV